MKYRIIIIPVVSWIVTITNAFTIITSQKPLSSLPISILPPTRLRTHRTTTHDGVVTSTFLLRFCCEGRQSKFHSVLAAQRNSNSDFDDEDDNDDDDDDDDDDEPPEVGDVETFRYNNINKKDQSSATGSSSSSSATSPISFGYNKGRSSPTTRKAIGKSSSSIATIYLCTHCGSEYVQWMGRCPTCKEWNTIQEHVVARATTAPSSSSSLRPIFGGGGGGGGKTHERPVGSW